MRMAGPGFEPSLSFHGGIGVRLIVSHLGKPGSIPSWVAPGFSQVGTVPDDAAGCRFSLGFPFSPVPSFQRCSILTSLHPSVIKKSMLRSPQISSLALFFKTEFIHFSKQTGFDFRRGRSRIFTSGTSSRRCRLSVGFIRDLPFLPLFIPPLRLTHMQNPGATPPGIEPGSPGWKATFLVQNDSPLPRQAKMVHCDAGCSSLVLLVGFSPFFSPHKVCRCIFHSAAYFSLLSEWPIPRIRLTVPSFDDYTKDTLIVSESAQMSCTGLQPLDQQSYRRSSDNTSGVVRAITMRALQCKPTIP
ncbi:hypothetical protein PR048_026380 [Dryococelus australis]|uniref:Uncharacterized protein n=1 Tax=Dryococelus australis TaxID=614101 RepID=A0ABQ9GL54_9NEOP|nr:hypothetical protein PR048_026380 [Dryococelus australis]